MTRGEHPFELTTADAIPCRRRGGVAERTNAAVLKTAVGQPTVGSNPTPSARLAW
jgi:hypothetical protein